MPERSLRKTILAAAALSPDDLRPAPDADTLAFMDWKAAAIPSSAAGS